MNKRFCPNCGAVLSRDNIFCGSCGAKIDEFGAVKSEKPTGTKRRPTGVMILAILNILGGIGGLIAGFGMMALSGDQYYLLDEEAALFGILGMLFIIIGLVDLVIGYGLWTLKRWGEDGRDYYGDNWHSMQYW
ncbi:zinc-ribbon domain-containing protein [Candidatus Methanophagaceae archaeon]|nr:zinc-ribbon domain-containing protein [Methanophagales archaeon]